MTQETQDDQVVVNYGISPIADSEDLAAYLVERYLGVVDVNNP